MVKTRKDRNAAGVAFACDAKASDNLRLHIDGREEICVLCNHLPASTESNTQSIQETQDETIGECCIDDVWAQQLDQKEDEPQQKHDGSLEQRMRG